MMSLIFDFSLLYACMIKKLYQLVMSYIIAPIFAAVCVIGIVCVVLALMYVVSMTYIYPLCCRIIVVFWDFEFTEYKRQKTLTGAAMSLINEAVDMAFSVIILGIFTTLIINFLIVGIMYECGVTDLLMHIGKFVYSCFYTYADLKTTCAFLF